MSSITLRVARALAGAALVSGLLASQTSSTYAAQPVPAETPPGHGAATSSTAAPGPPAPGATAVPVSTLVVGGAAAAAPTPGATGTASPVTSSTVPTGPAPTSGPTGSAGPTESAGATESSTESSTGSTTDSTTGSTTGTGVGGFGAVAGASVAPLFDRLRLAASFVVAARLQPGGGSGSEQWRPPADLRTPRVIAATPTARPGPAGPSTLEEALWAAYASAVDGVRGSCHLPVTLLAAIGEVESSSLRGRSLDAGHDVVPPVLGPRLTGGGLAAIRDSDGGRLDGDPVWDRAVGPMQFIPGTWRIWGADGSGDGVADPQNIEDATLTAARYLCANGRDLSRASDLASAVLSYNGSQRYLATVIGLMDAVTSGASAAP